MPKMFEHHRTRPDLADGVSDIFAVNIRRAAVHRLEARRKFAFRIQVCRGRDADGAGTCGAEIGKNIAEKIGADDDIKPIRMLHKMRGENIDMVLRGLDVRIFRRHFLEALIPVRHGDSDAVRLGRRGDVFSLARFGELKSVFQNAIHAAPCKDGLLHTNLVFGAAVQPPADGRIFALIVFAHHPEIDIARLPARQGRRHTRHQAHRADVGVKLKLATNWNQQPPQRNVIRHSRKADRAEKDCVVLADSSEAIVRHHLAVFGVVIAAPGHFIELKLDVEFSTDRFEYTHALGHDLLADTVTRDDGDFVFAHGALRIYLH